MKEQSVKKKVGKKPTIQRQAKREPQNALEKKKNFVSIQVEYPESNLKQYHQIAKRFIERFDGLVKQGVFADLEKEFEQSMRRDPDDKVLEVKLGIGLHDFFDSDKPQPLKYSMMAFDKSGKIDVLPDQSTIARYLVEDRIVEANSDTCPSCRHRWTHKIFNHSCPKCGDCIGSNVKFVLQENDDECPHCRHPGLSESEMVCKGCGHRVHEETIVRLHS